MDRILRGPGALVELRNYSAAGDLVDAGGGNATVVVKDSAAATVGGITTGTHISTGVYRVTIPSSLTILDEYEVAWTMPDATTRKTHFELVGTFLFTQAELRAVDSVLEDETAFPDERLVEVREETEQRFEAAGNVSFTLRGDREYVDGNGLSAVMSRHQELQRLVSAKIDGNAIDVSEVAVYPHGRLYRSTGWTSSSVGRNVELLVEHGYAEVPEPVRAVGLLFARAKLLRSALEQSDRATAVFTDIGGFRITLAGKDGPTGIPEVDAVIGPDGFGRRAAGAFA